jgi:hypothetical protein
LGRALADQARHLRDRARARDTSGGKPVAVFRFLSEDWSPWIALLRMRERWPELHDSHRKPKLASSRASSMKPGPRSSISLPPCPPPRKRSAPAYIHVRQPALQNWCAS